MTLTTRIEQDYLKAYKAKEAVTVAVLRMLKTAMTNRVKDLGRPLDDPEVLDAIAKQVKQRKESIEQYDKAGRKDLADIERAEMAVLEGYLPKQLSDEDLALAVDQAIAASGAASMKDMGKVMQALAQAHKGQYDGRKASDMVRSRLNS